MYQTPVELLRLAALAWTAEGGHPYMIPLWLS
jgi:hypothetical protein